MSENPRGHFQLPDISSLLMLLAVIGMVYGLVKCVAYCNEASHFFDDFGNLLGLDE